MQPVSGPRFASMENVVGNRLRQARMARQLSLSDVAGRAKISVATLSRIERDKQGIDLGLFLTLTRILKSSTHELLADGTGIDTVDPLAVRIASLHPTERVRLWRELTDAHRSRRVSKRGAQIRNLGEQVEELLAQIEFLHAEIESVQRRLRLR
jgi:transcriptional regulator with XRE-family HTH domain